MFVENIPKELIKGNEYTSEEILGYMLENDVNILCDNVPYINEKDNSKYMVIDNFEKYKHFAKNNSYNVPSSREKFYIISKTK